MIKAPSDPVAGENLLPRSSHGRKGKGDTQGLSYKGTNPIQ